MQKVLDHYKTELKSLRTNRPSSAMFDGINIEVYGTKMRLKELGTISIVDDQIIITPFDPNNARAIAKGIEKANLGFLPVVEGTIVRVSVPPMSEERRREIVKEAKEKGEKAKIKIREERRKAKDWTKKRKLDGDISEDEQRKDEQQIQKFANTFCDQIDDMFHVKEREILQV